MVPFIERAQAYCELRVTRNRLKAEMHGDPCTEREIADYETGIGVLACYLEYDCKGEQMPVDERCEACQRNDERHRRLMALASKMGGAHRAMLTAWKRENL